jgi:hypothetical protein
MKLSTLFASAFALPLRIMLLVFTLMTSATSSQADSSSPSLASYYDRHMALQGDVAYGWIGRGQPARMMAGVVQVGVSDKAYFALLADACPVEIVTGAEDEGEMGAWHFVQAPLRLRTLELALEEYLRFGLEAGYDTCKVDVRWVWGSNYYEVEPFGFTASVFVSF